MNSEPVKIAVIGSGVAGLTAAHILQRKHHVTLFEKDDRLGGHTNTVAVPEGPDAGIPVDTGFIVMNHRNYPLLTRLFEQLGVELRDSDMSFGYYDVPSGLQYSGSGLNGLFAQRINLLRPSFHRMVRDVLRFFKIAQQTIDENSLVDETLGEYLQRHAFSSEFIDHHLIPMGSAIWSTPCDSMLQFPALSFLQFFRNHGLLTVNDRPQWRTVLGGSSTYIARMRQQWSQVTVRLNACIAGIERRSSGAELRFRDGGT
ncbi:MAG: FAD-dependent oxidoreductase [Kiritimatiellae bacterium]|nr:FAD-dependent oxidoreductase [Kiritimatiellia bacterium]